MNKKSKKKKCLDVISSSFLKQLFITKLFFINFSYEPKKEGAFKQQSSIAMNNMPFFQVDVNYDSLKQFLDEVTRNQDHQNEKIEEIKKDLKIKPKIDEVI